MARFACESSEGDKEEYLTLDDFACFATREKNYVRKMIGSTELLIISHVRSTGKKQKDRWMS